MLSKRMQLYSVGMLVVVTTLANCIRSTMYLAGYARTDHFKDELAIAPELQQQQQQQQQSDSAASAASTIRSATDAGRNLAAVMENTQKRDYELSLLGVAASDDVHNSDDSSSSVTTTTMTIRKDDSIYQKSLTDFDTSPIVIEKYKLVFFTLPKVACTTWKFLFRRMMGFDNWDLQDAHSYMPHHPDHNGLKYLYNYSIEEATEMMTSPEWTRAMFVRDPKRRFLSAFLDKVFHDDADHVKGHCCPQTKDCVPYEAEGFLTLIHTCHDSHWIPQHYRLPPRYWKYMNFIGKLDTVQEDAKRLLQRIGAWEEYGKTGWGGDGGGEKNNKEKKEEGSGEEDRAIFAKSETQQTHVTYSEFQIWRWYTPALERKVEAFYAMDYGNPLFNFTMQNLTKDFFIQPRDKVWVKGDWDGAPIVSEKYKLIFYTIPRIGATQWKMLFRRIAGLEDWKMIGGDDILPHNPDKNGLKYLNDYDIDTASNMITGNEYTKAIFVRNPKDRFLSIYYDLRYHKAQIESQCCPDSPGCFSQMSSLVRFLDLMQDCASAHWDPQYFRMEDRYWKHIDHVGYLENAQEDAKKILQKVGAWEEYGATGWGPNGNQSIFAPTGHEADHVRQAMASYTPVVDRLVERTYQADYNNDIFHFPNTLWAVTQR